MHGFQPRRNWIIEFRAPISISVSLQKKDAEGPHEQSGISFTLRKVSPELSGIHGLLRAHILERAKIISAHHEQHRQHDRAFAKKAETPSLKFMNDLLNERNHHKFSRPYSLSFR